MLRVHFSVWTKAILQLTGLSVGAFVLSFGIHAAIAAYTLPTQNPPNGNVAVTLDSVTDAGAATANSLTVGGLVNNGALTQNGANAYLNQTANSRFYFDSKRGVQLRIDSDNNEAATFAINNGANEEVLKIDENGNITAKSGYAPSASMHLTTKGYVDTAVAAAGGGDATLANQNTIIGNQSITHSKIDVVQDNMGDATSANQEVILSKIQNLNTIVSDNAWVAAPQTFFAVGGLGDNTVFCQQRNVSSGGAVTVSNVNDGSVCKREGAVSYYCATGACTKQLTWSGSSKSEKDCENAGGIVYNTGSGTICKIIGNDISCPSGWTQANRWQKYKDLSDACSSSGSYPTTFTNQSACIWYKGTQQSYLLHYTDVIGNTHWVRSDNCAEISNQCSIGGSYIEGPESSINPWSVYNCPPPSPAIDSFDSNYYVYFNTTTSSSCVYNSAIGRTAIGCY